MKDLIPYVLVSALIIVCMYTTIEIVKTQKELRKERMKYCEELCMLNNSSDNYYKCCYDCLKWERER